MDGAKLHTSLGANGRILPGGARPRFIATLVLLAPMALLLAQCGRAPGPGMLAANAQGSRQGSVTSSEQGSETSSEQALVTGSVPDSVQTSGRASFNDRFPAPGFAERFPTASQSFKRLEPAQTSSQLTQRSKKPAAARYQVASLEPTAPYQRPEPAGQTTLVGLKYSAFPYLGNNPRTDAPFLDIVQGERRGHRSYGGRVYWQNETYSDNRVLMHIPQHFDLNKPGVIVVFFHGNGATLERDVRDRQLVPQQVSESGANAVLLAPQLAVDAADSSAGKFWQPGGLKRFIDEAAEHLAMLYGEPGSAKKFANLPVILVGYSGGFVPTAYSLEVGGLGHRIRGVFLLDAVYGELDKFASWIENNRGGFFVSAYTRYTKPHDQELIQMLRAKGITVDGELDGPLHPGSVVFMQSPDGVTHRDYVTRAWTEDPVREVLAKMAATPALTRVATGN